MKKYIISLFALVTFVPVIWAENPYNRIFSGGEHLYFNMKAISWWNSPGNTGKDGEGNFAYFFNNNNNNAWSAHAILYKNDIYYIEVPAGTWDHVILTRNSVSTNPSWTNIYNKTGDLSMQSGNYIASFKENSSDTGDWGRIVVTPTGTPASIMSPTVNHVCSNAAGEPYVLNAMDIVNCAWFRYNGTTWDEMIPGANKDTLYVVTKLSNDPNFNYFYLVGEPLSAQQMIQVKLDQNCQLSCDITSFEMVPSAADIQNKTFAIDGIVAFAKADGSLKISCDDKDTTIWFPQTPQVFKLTGLKADGKPHTVTAQFLSGEKCQALRTITAPTPATPPAPVVYKRYVGDTLTIYPQSRESKDLIFSWSDNYPKHDHAMQMETDTVFDLVFTDYNKIPELPTNLITNGSYEDDIDYAPYSDYTYWGRGDSLNNFYTTHPNYSGGFAVVKNANNFANTYATVKAHDGNWFALFDADNSGKKNAWYVTSQATAPNLKIVKGMSYMFSFWVCNINNFAQMDNCAILQFYIQCDNNTEQPLGNPIKLADYHDNLWHQNSSIYTATSASDNVKIMVKDLNTSTQFIGNDFGLDDIQFRAISVNTQVVHAQERFTVSYQQEDHNTYSRTFCHTEKQTFSASTNKLHETASEYIWNGPCTQKDSVYYHPLEIDLTKQEQPQYFDTLICKSYKQPYKILLSIDTFFITVDPCRLCDDTLALSKWDDVLFIQNQSDRYVAYQWLKNDEIMHGQTEQFIDAKDDLEAYYACLVTTTTGTVVRTCNRKVGDLDSHNKKPKQTEPIRKIVTNGNMYILIDGIQYSILGAKL